MRLIDADRLIKMTTHWKPYMDMDNVRSAIEHMPTIDAVPVVRCGECKHYHEETGWCDELSYFQTPNGEPCSPAESMDWKMFERDDFCSYGEWKDGGGND